MKPLQHISVILLSGLMAATITIVATAQQPISATVAVQSSTANLPVVKSTELSPYLDIPWSQLVQVADPFEGNFVAVFDRNDISSSALGYSGVGHIVSLWTRKSIQLQLTVNQGLCGSAYPSNLYAHSFGYGYPRFHRRGFYKPAYFYGPPCVNLIVPKTIQQLLLKVGDQVLRLEGTQNVFRISDEVAVALRKAPDRNVDIRMVLNSGETVDSQIGKGTVMAWRSIY